MNSLSFKSSSPDNKAIAMNVSEAVDRSIRLTNAYIVLNTMMHKINARGSDSDSSFNQVATVNGHNAVGIDKSRGLASSNDIRSSNNHDHEQLLLHSMHDKIAQSLKTVEMVASNEWGNCGQLYYRQNNYVKALKCFTEKLKLLCNQSNNLRVATLLSEFARDENCTTALYAARTKAMMPSFLDLALTVDVCTTLHWYD